MRKLTIILFIFLAASMFAQKTNVREHSVIIRAINYTGIDYNFISWFDRYEVWHDQTVKTCLTVQTKYNTGDDIKVTSQTLSREMRLIIILDGDTICNSRIKKYKKEIFKYTIQ